MENYPKIINNNPPYLVNCFKLFHSRSSTPTPVINGSSPPPSSSHIQSPSPPAQGASPVLRGASPVLVPSPLALTPNRAHQQRTSPAAPVVPSSPIIPNRNSPQRGASTLPPMPPLLNYQKSLFPATNGLHSNSNHSSKHSSPIKERLEAHSSPSYTTSTNLFSSSKSVPTTTSWLTALSETAQGQKRPPPAHTGSVQPPPAKRPYLDNINKSATPSPNSNMSPLVGEWSYLVRSIQVVGAVKQKWKRHSDIAVSSPQVLE